MVHRNDTWAGQASPWVNDLARSSYMLQQGHFGADLLNFYGEESNLTAIFQRKSPDIPAGYAFDYINADALIHELSIANGGIVPRSGMEYKALGLDPHSCHMSLPVLRAIHALVENGAVVAGPKPTDDSSLADDQSEFEWLSSQLFGDGSGFHKLGKGIVYAGQNLNEVFSALYVQLGFDYVKHNSDSDVEFTHRRLKNGHIYFIDNRSNHDESIGGTFRVAGMQTRVVPR